MDFLTEIEKKKAARDQDTERREKQIANYREQIKEKRAEMSEAMTAGDYKSYTAAEYEVKELENAIMFAEKAAENAQEGQEAAIKASWGKYAAEYNKAFEKAYNDYKKALEATADIFRSLARVQNEGLKRRKAYRDYMGEYPAGDFLMVPRNSFGEPKDLKFFAQEGLLTADEEATIDLILNECPQEDINSVPANWLAGAMFGRKGSIYDVINERRKIIRAVRSGKEPLSAINWLQDYDNDTRKNIYMEMFEEDYVKVMKRNGVENYA